MNFTDRQEKAIKLEGDSLTVSAAAGSGKTAVLSERVVRRLCDPKKNASADRLLILTFTNAAAAQMRRRITDALKKRLQNEPENAYIKKQLAVLPAAKICTIHSACLELVRNNFDALGLDPLFTVAEETRLNLINSEITEGFVEELYGRAEVESDIDALIEYFSHGRDDRALFTALESGCAFLENEPYPEDFIKSTCDRDTENAFDMLPNGFLKKYTVNTLTEIISDYGRLSLKAESLGFEKLCEFYDSERTLASLILKYASAGDYGMSVNAARDIKFKNHPPRPKDTDISLWNSLKDERNDLKKRLISLKDGFLYADEDAVLRDRSSELYTVKTLLCLSKELSDRRLGERRKLRLVSFNDAEHYALSLLIERHDSECTMKTPLAQELSEFYDEIIVDEFQDCSKIQDYIFKALSKNGKNIFTVGDVKQSIYRFRNAYPQLFIQKQESAVDPLGEVLTAPSRISLNNNFRSHPKILEFINTVFDPLMTKARCDIDYSGSHRLTSGDIYPCDAASVTVSLLTGAEDEKQNAASRLENEARFVAQKIKSVIGRLEIYDRKEQRLRTVKADDIAILMRAPKTSGAVFEKALEEVGIGCINNNPSEKYLDTPQVRDILAYLQVIDNPYNDIPLITLMYSDYFGFTVNELGRIRTLGKNMPFFDAVKLYAENDGKARRFVDTVEDYRQKSVVTDVYGLISMIYEQSGILLHVLTEPDGEAARANLMLLSDFAADFESTRYRGLFSFISYVLKLIEKDQTVPSAKLRSSGGCVNLLSIHRSKGLEYPVVFLVNTGNDIITSVNGEILLDRELGAGAYIKDSTAHRDFSSVCRNAVKEKTKTDEINEYLRLLYVALTRAESHLFITAAMNYADAEKAIVQAHESGGKPTDYAVTSRASFFRWMLYPLIKHRPAAPFLAFAGLDTSGLEDSALFSAEIMSFESDTAPTAIKEREKNGTTELSEEYIEKMLAREYRYEKSTQLPSKLSVSEIKSMQSGKLGIKSVPRPRFLQSGANGADRGNANHRFLQFCDFGRITDLPSLESEISRLAELEFISERDCTLLEKDKLLRFLQSDMMRHLNSLGTCKKEQRFLFTVPANEITDTDCTDSITVQGVIDCWYTENGRAVIVDYKTDAVKSADELRERYAIQLEMYSAALLKTKGLETSHRYIYSFALSEFIEV